MSDNIENAVPGPANDPTEALKRRLEETRLPADLKEQILAELPPLEEQERLCRELQEQGGLSFEQFCASLGIEVQAGDTRHQHTVGVDSAGFRRAAS